MPARSCNRRLGELLVGKVVGALKVQSETTGLEGLLAHMTNDCSFRLFPCSDSFPQTVVRICRELDPYLPWHAHHRLRLLCVRGKTCAFEGRNVT